MFIIESGGAHASRAGQGVCLLLSLSTHMFSNLRKAGLIMCNGFLRKKKAMTTNILFSSFFTPAFIAEHCAMWHGTSLWRQSGSAVLFLFSQLLVPQSSLLARQHEKLMYPGLCVNTALQHLNLLKCTYLDTSFVDYIRRLYYLSNECCDLY